MSRQGFCVRADGEPKRTYFTKAEAKFYARVTASAERSRASGRPALHVYHCPDCRHYHVGHDGSDLCWNCKAEPAVTVVTVRSYPPKQIAVCGPCGDSLNAQGLTERRAA